MTTRSMLIAAVLLGSTAIGHGGEVNFTVLDEGTKRIMPARIHLADETGTPQRAEGLPFWRDHFVCEGTAKVDLAEGRYRYTVERGPEFNSIQGEVAVEKDGGPRSVTVSLRRLADLASEGWWSGETHVHRPRQDVELLMRAEDLHAAQVITWWNATNPWKPSDVPERVVVNFDGNRSYQVMAGEDERDGGALLFGDLAQPLEITEGKRHFPSSLVYARAARARGAQWIDAEKPFWWDFPMWLAHGVADTAGIAHNHMHRGGVLENEAWGRARDRAKYPAPLGNALWTLQIYYHALNCGLRLPPSAGSASGVLPNPAGYNRAYVQMEGAYSHAKWQEGLLAGRSFVSNGPLLRCQAGGKWPGHTFKADKTLELEIAGKLDSRDPIAAVELVRNGRAERIELPAKIRIEESGWFLVRAVANLTNTYRFASTAPWHVEIGGKPMAPRPESARFFVEWCDERMAQLESRTELSPEQKAEVIAPWKAARAFWQAKAAGE